jgi:hypothetical protein
MTIINKVIDLVKKKPYFERCKWSKYLLSLWNNDIQNNDWLTLFLSYGNLISGDFILVMRHEEGIQLIADLIHKALAYIELFKYNIKENISIRKSIEK